MNGYYDLSDHIEDTRARNPGWNCWWKCDAAGRPSIVYEFGLQW